MRIKSGSFDELKQEIKLYNKKIVIFGAGVIGAVTVPGILASYHLIPSIECYLDNDRKRWGDKVITEDGPKPVCSPQYLQTSGRDIVILLSISRYAGVLEQLEQTECLKDVSCYIVPVMCIMNFHREGGRGVSKDSNEPLIPKIIHYMWLGGKPIPEQLQYCMDSWKKYCPDYEIIRWDESNYDLEKHFYMKQAYENGMYGFVPDYARLDILYQHGGIYMDTDVEVIKSLDELLYQQAFCGVEKWQVINLGGCSGAVQGQKAVKALLDARQNISFVEKDGSLNKNTCGFYDTRVMLNNGYKMDGTCQRILDMNIYTYDYFHPYDYISRKTDITSDTYTIHHFNGGWLDENLKSANEKTARMFEKIGVGDKCMDTNQYVIYGAGGQGQGYFEFLKSKGLDSYIFGFCDRNYQNIGRVCGKQVYSYEDVKARNFPFIVAIADEEAKNEIARMMDDDGARYCPIDELAEAAGMDRVAFNREFCGYFHISNMDTYFINAENDGSMNVFWKTESHFYRLFQMLDLSNVIELACGRGRHVPKYADRAGHITLVDILNQNIEFCKERFKEFNNISYYCNNGFNLEKLDSNTYSALFSYDAMVHFEMMDIYEYLKDIYRVLQPGGRVLLHHSNNDKNYKASFGNATEGRSFMNKQIFAYLAYRSGFTVMRQEIIDWGIRELDCITLLEKPERQR